MIEKALKYINSLKEPVLHLIDGEQYSDKPLHRISYNPKAEPIELNTLTSLVDYIVSEFDAHDKLFVHVVSPTRVDVFSELDRERTREEVLVVKAFVPSFQFGQFVGSEAFNIGLQSKFLDADDRALVLKFAGATKAGTVAEYSDDGVTQKATVKVGVASTSDAIVPNPVTLRAYRTFLEVEQPSAKYVFRMKQGGAGDVQCALFEADGGAWQIEAKEAVKNYLVSELDAYENIVVIS
jgi:hypothetical protein